MIESNQTLMFNERVRCGLELPVGGARQPWQDFNRPCFPADPLPALTPEQLARLEERESRRPLLDARMEAQARERRSEGELDRAAARVRSQEQGAAYTAMRSTQAAATAAFNARYDRADGVPAWHAALTAEALAMAAYKVATTPLNSRPELRK